MTTAEAIAFWIFVVMTVGFFVWVAWLALEEVAPSTACTARRRSCHDALPAADLPRRPGRQHALRRHVRRLRLRDRAATRAARAASAAAPLRLQPRAASASYCFIGAAGRATPALLLVGPARRARRQAARRSACWRSLSGALMVFIGLQFFGLLRHARAALARAPAASCWRRRCAALLQGAGARPRRWRFGVLNGFCLARWSMPSRRRPRPAAARCPGCRSWRRSGSAPFRPCW